MLVSGLHRFGCKGSEFSYVRILFDEVVHKDFTVQAEIV